MGNAVPACVGGVGWVPQPRMGVGGERRQDRARPEVAQRQPLRSAGASSAAPSPAAAVRPGRFLRTSIHPQGRAP